MGYIPQSKLSVNLDNVYVKKPCPIGNSLSTLIDELSAKIPAIVGEVVTPSLPEFTPNRFLFDVDMSDNQGLENAETELDS